MPVLPGWLLEPVGEQCAALVPDRPSVAPRHPLGGHRPRGPDRTVFEHVGAALGHGSGYERIASSGCSDRTIRRRVKGWAGLGLLERRHALAWAQYDRLIGPELEQVCAGGGITTAPGGGEAAGRAPVDRGKPGRTRTTVTDRAGIPLHLGSAPANRHASRLLRPTLAGRAKLAPLPEPIPAHLERAVDSAPCRALLDERGVDGAIARTGVPAPSQAGARWVVERPPAGLTGSGKRRRCTERDRAVVAFHLFLAATFVVVRALLRRARSLYRWPTRPTTTRLK